MGGSVRPTDSQAEVLTRVWTPIEARVIVELLGAYGIGAWAVDAPAFSPVELGETNVIVATENLEAAAAILAEHAGDFPEPGGAV